MHKVLCVYCRKSFDRDKYPFTQISAKRYAHPECAKEAQEKLSQEEKDKKELEDYILKLFKIDFLDIKIRKQIKDYKENNQYSYSGIRRSLTYFYEVKKNSIEKANGGIGIVPYVYNDAHNYYYSLWLANQNNQDKKIEDYIPEEKIIYIKEPTREVRKRKLFSFLDDEVKE